MRLALIVAAVMALVAAAPATAHRGGGPGGDGPRGFHDDGPRSDDRFGFEAADGDEYEALDEAEDVDEEDVEHQFAGTVVSTDVADGELRVRLGAPRGGGHRGHRGPRRGRTMEFEVDSDTGIERGDADATLADIQKGDKVEVTVVAPADADRDEIESTPAWLVSAYARQSFYGFGGRIVSIDLDARKLTIDVRYATKEGRRLLADTTERQLTFTVDDETRLPGSELSSLTVGKLVGIGIASSPTSTLDQVLATAADVVVAGRGGSARLGNAAAARAKRASRGR